MSTLNLRENNNKSSTSFTNNSSINYNENNLRTPLIRRRALRRHRTLTMPLTRRGTLRTKTLRSQNFRLLNPTNTSGNSTILNSETNTAYTNNLGYNPGFASDNNLKPKHEEHTTKTPVPEIPADVNIPNPRRTSSSLGVTRSSISSLQKHSPDTPTPTSSFNQPVSKLPTKPINYRRSLYDQQILPIVGMPYVIKLRHNYTDYENRYSKFFYRKMNYKIKRSMDHRVKPYILGSFIGFKIHPYSNMPTQARFSLQFKTYNKQIYNLYTQDFIFNTQPTLTQDEIIDIMKILIKPHDKTQRDTLENQNLRKLFDSIYYYNKDEDLKKVEEEQIDFLNYNAVIEEHMYKASPINKYYECNRRHESINTKTGRCTPKKFTRRIKNTLGFYESYNH